MPDDTAMPPATGGSPFNVVANWNLNQLPVIANGTIDTTFPKGMAFSQWLGNVGINLPIAIMDSKRDVDSLNPMYSQRWIYNAQDNNAVEHFTFNTPINPNAVRISGKVP